MILEAERRDIAVQSAILDRHGLAPASSGNVSARRDELFAITPAGAWLGEIDPAACVVLDLDGRVVEGSDEPSSETPMHRAVYRAHRPGAIVHTHSVYATVLSTLVDEIPAIHYIVGLFGGPVPVVPYVRFGTEELGQKVAQQLADRRAVLLQNHGALIMADSVREACALALQLEWVANVYYHARLVGGARLLTREELAEAAEAMGARRYRR
ncbi:MAG TPA: class II aldolase/adducin family protein [Candidatus Dormibacteraeota bacterium]|nr:class II aldolase/adducin family protein [Candidatus Dormibacteraeota bacterium]